MYCIDPSASTPIFLLDKQIGQDDENPDAPFIDGNAFARELMEVDSYYKPKNIEVWINSPGGSVTQGQSIYFAILATDAKVDTVVTGMACSIAAVIFQAGRNRIMMDYSKLMYHPVSGASPTSEGKKQLETFTHSVATMVTKGDETKLESVLKMMAKTTWINADEAIENGLCNEKRNAGSMNKPRMTTDPKAFHLESVTLTNQLVNKLKTDNNKNTNMEDMTKINNKLKLTSAANIDQQIEAIDSLSNKAKEAEEKSIKLESEMKDLKSKLEAKQVEIDALKTDLDAKNVLAADADKKAKKADAENKVRELGKKRLDLKDANILNKWVEKYVADPDGTTEIINAIALNEKAANLDQSGDEENKIITPLGNKVIGNMMADIREKNKL